MHSFKPYVSVEFPLESYKSVLRHSPGQMGIQTEWVRGLGDGTNLGFVSDCRIRIEFGSGSL